VSAPDAEVSMPFIQMIKFTTTKIDEIENIMQEWKSATEGERSTTKYALCVDRENPNKYVQIVEFPSYEEAMKNSELPATTKFSAEFASYCDEGPTFRNLDVLQSESLG
jgi:quinol monooxygenase YgiN